MDLLIIFQTVGNYHLGYPILANKLEDIDNKEKYSYFISIGNNLNRLKHFLNLSKIIVILSIL